MADRKRTIYRLGWPQDGEGGVGCAPETFPANLVEATEPVGEWRGFELRLGEGGFVDYQPNDVGVPLCSAKMRRVVDGAASSEDRIEWLPVDLVGDGEAQPYFILHVLTVLDVIDTAKSVMAGSAFVIKPHLRLASVGDHQIFVAKGTTASVIYVAESLRKALLAECTGCAFWRIAAS